MAEIRPREMRIWDVKGWGSLKAALDETRCPRTASQGNWEKLWEVR